MHRQICELLVFRLLVLVQTALVFAPASTTLAGAFLFMFGATCTGRTPTSSTLAALGATCTRLAPASSALSRFLTTGNQKA